MSTVWAQYKRLKAQVPGCLMLFRYGDFYELFDADAEVAAPVLDIVLTSREMGCGNRVKMAGIPHHALNSYIPKLLAAGYRVAVVEQVGQPSRPGVATPLLAGPSGAEGGRGPATAEDGRGVMERQVVRVVSAGTVVEPGLLDERSNNYLAAVVVEDRRGGLAYVDVTTGEFAACQVTGSQALRSLQQELERLRPAEVLVPRLDGRTRLADPPPLPDGSHATVQDAWRFELDNARETLLNHFGVASLDGFGCQGVPLAVMAAGAIVLYLQETNRLAAAQLTDLRVYSTDSFMALDPATRRNLEILQTGRGGTVSGSLLWALDQTKTPMGGRLLRRWLGQPLLDLAPLEARQAMVEQLVADSFLRAKLVERLRRVGDLERLVGRIGQRLASPRDLIALRTSLVAVAELRELGLTSAHPVAHSPQSKRGEGLAAELTPRGPIDHAVSASPPAPTGSGRSNEAAAGEDDERATEGRASAPEGAGQLRLPAASGYGSEGRAGVGHDSSAGDSASAEGVVEARPGPSVRDLLARLDACQEIEDLISRALVPEPAGSPGDGVIAPGFSAELDELVASTKHAREWIAGLEAKEREATGIRSLKVGYNKVFGYYLEVSHANRDLVPDSYVRRQTLVNAERYITSELKEYEALVLGAQEKIADLESAIFRQVCAEVVQSKSRVLRTADLLAQLDVFASLAEVAVRHGYVRPKLHDGPAIRIVGGRHPVVELARRDEPFVPNDVYLSNDDAQVAILTGPNMSGKSTFLRQVALIVLMAQIGSFVPAEQAEIGLVDRIFTRIGAQDDLGAGQSTFLLEMLETANLLTQSTPRSLLILDEVGRGTSTYDGLAIAQAVIEHIHNHPRLRAKTLFATHYHELTELARVLPRVRNYRVDVREEGDSVVFLHRVVAGAADRSYGIHVARLAGVPRGVTRRAEEILRELEEGPRSRGRSSRRRDSDDAWQLSLMLEPHPVVEELKALDVLSLTPLEAITKLFELQQKARGRDTS